MTRKSLVLASVIFLFFMFITFVRFHQEKQFRYKYTIVKYSWGEISGSLFDTSFNGSKYSLGIGVKTNEISDGKIYISNIVFKGSESGHSFALKNSAKEDKILKYYAAFDFLEKNCRYEDYIVRFNVTVSSTSLHKTIDENVILPPM